MVNIRNIKLYLERLGWKAFETNRLGIVGYSEPIEINPVEIFLPLNEKDNLSELYFKEAIRILSFIYSQEESIINKTIDRLDHDLINYRLHEIESDSVQLTFLEELLKATKNSLKYAARAEYAVFYKSLGTKIREKYLSPTEHIDSFLNNLTFAHTWKGSYGITIESPLEIDSLGLFKLEDSVGRKTTKRLHKGHKIISDAASAESANYILDHIESKEEINLLSPYVALEEEIKEKKVDVIFNFSPIIDFKSIEGYDQPIVLNKKSLRYLSKAVSQLTEENSEITIDFIGFPEVIRSTMEGLKEDCAFFESDRLVTVKGVSQQTGPVALRMTLSLEDYRKALRAQEEVKHVRVICVVKRKLKGWEVLKVESFDLIT